MNFTDWGNVGQLQISYALLQTFDQSIHTSASRAVAAFHVLRTDVRMGHGRDRLVNVIEDHHAVVEGEAEIGKMAVVGRRIRQVLDVADRVITGIADRSTRKAW